MTFLRYIFGDDGVARG
uniref:Uncharacterized protein n=1 Tax=Arundo donax TaxID=35708 RepID=A0A0A9GJA3_ARUDO